MIKTDKIIQREVMDELLWEPSLHAESIGVQVSKGIVTLTGSVNTYWEKTCAETSAQRVTGVKGLVMDLSTDSATFNTRTDADIASAARNALGYILPVSSDNVKIEVHKGAVTLSGEVHSWAERLAVSTAAWCAPGVTDVKDTLVIR